MTARDAAGGRHRADARLLAALAAGATGEEAAKVARVSASTVDRRLRDPVFRAELGHIRARSLARAADGLASAAIRAVATLASVLDDLEAPTAARITAARAILDHAGRFEWAAREEPPSEDPSAAVERIRELIDDIGAFRLRSRDEHDT